MGKQTPLYQAHRDANAKIVDFAGWDMPLHYGSQVEEHHYVRTDAGVFDVSHMTILDCQGEQASAFLRHLLANNVDRLYPGKALYTCMLDENGGIIDDLIVYKITDHLYRLIVNSATHDTDVEWIERQARHFNINIKERVELAMIAVQGPKAIEKLQAVLPKSLAKNLTELKPFHAVEDQDFFVARTGYTGEDGVEIILPASQVLSIWQALLNAGVHPCGLGARDTLRLEAGLNLYGVDMDKNTSPLESNLAWTIAFDPVERNFIGRKALETQRMQGISYKLTGVVLLTPGVLRNHQKVFVDGECVGEITSGSFSPTLNKGIAFARIHTHVDSKCTIEIRGKHIPAEIVPLPFVRHGKSTLVELVK